MKFQQIGLTMLSAVFLWGCWGDRLDGKVMKTEMNRRRIIRVTDAQLLTLATNKGKKLLREADSIKNLNPNLTREKAYLSIEQSSLKPPVYLELPVVGTLPIKLSPKLEEVRKSYEGFAEADATLGDNIQKLGDTSFAFTRPIMAEGKAKAISLLIISKVVLVDEQAQKGKKWGKPVQ